MKVNVYNQKAEVVGETDLNPAIFGVKPKEHLLAEAVRIQLSGTRKGLAHTKTRGEVRGGGKKPWKQKGTGRARAGSTRGPIWRHGGVAFGPRSDRNWELKLNKKAKTKALFMSLSDKAKDNKLVVVENIDIKPKTKEMVQVLKDFKLKIQNLGKRQLIVAPRKNESVFKASRNIPETEFTLASSLNVVSVLKADGIIIIKDALPVVEKTYLKKAVSKADIK